MRIFPHQKECFHIIHLKKLIMQSKIREFVQRTAKIGNKKMMFCIVLIMGLSSFSTLLAQRGGMQMDTAAMRQRTEARLAKAKSDLNLTQTQADSLKAITTEFSQKRRDVFMDPANQGLSREDRMAKMQPLTDAMNTRLQAAFGADLFKKYQAWEAENRPQRPGGGGGNQ
jgi:hypothetical protein